MDGRAVDSIVLEQSWRGRISLMVEVGANGEFGDDEAEMHVAIGGKDFGQLVRGANAANTTNICTRSGFIRMKMVSELTREQSAFFLCDFFRDFTKHKCNT